MSWPNASLLQIGRAFAARLARRNPAQPSGSAETILPRSEQPDEPGYVAIFKIAEFESLRAEFGFAHANATMQLLASRVRLALNRCDIGRTGRTTIEAWFQAADDDAARAQLTDAKIRLEASLAIAGVDLSFAVSCGATPRTHGQADTEALDRAANALAEAQAAHKSLVLNADSNRRDMLGDLELARALKVALENDQLQLHYQPKLHCRDDAIRSVEALLRWSHPEFGAMPIERVIAVAERTGAIKSLTDWVVDRAARDHAILADAGFRPVVFVNLSGRLLADRAYIDRLIPTLKRAGGSLGIEITETSVIHDPADALANVTAISEAGIHVAIDDYGSGLSSLAYLKQLPAKELKIDRLFIRDLVQSHRDPLLVRSSIDLAHALDMEVTAEGVDNGMTLSLLRVMGCDIIQGYLVSPPLPLGELIPFLKDAGRLQGIGRGTLTLPHLGSAA